MPLSPIQKQDIIKQYQTIEGDTGSPEVQIALLTHRINALTDHLKTHPHDVHSRRGLLSMIAKRRRLIYFLQKTDKKRAEHAGIEHSLGRGQMEISDCWLAANAMARDRLPAGLMQPKEIVHEFRNGARICRDRSTS